MNIKIKSPLERSPVNSIAQNTIVVSESNSTILTHRDLIYRYITGATLYNDYLVTGSELPVTVVNESIPGAVNINDWPLVKRNEGVNAIVSAQFQNSRCTTSPFQLDFRTSIGNNYNMLPHDYVEDTLFSHTYQIVNAIADAMTSASMWDSNGNRAQTDVIPHEYLTGHVWNGLWGGGAADGAGTRPTTGRRFMPITRRHLYACGHYQYSVGQNVYWKDINNNIITRQVIHVINLDQEIAQALGILNDVSITLLNADLPSSINVLPVTDEWVLNSNVVSGTNVTRCKQICGFGLLNNDGHFLPFSENQVEDSVMPLNPYSYEGINFDNSKLIGAVGSVMFNYIDGRNPFLSPGDKFYHDTRGGDSGSPCIVPCAEGWAYSGHVSRNFHWTPDILNQLIDLTDTRAVLAGRLGSPTGYTVAVATAPTI